MMKKRRRSNHRSLSYRGEEALKKAVAEAIAKHRRNGVPVAIWRNGKVVRIPVIRSRFGNLDVKSSKKSCSA
jgi:ribosomal protein S12 methylthiotransferase accessory factor YcaO